ncbi:MAG: PqqD family protein [Spirochaetales bacterium]|jgi:hypothetical protein|nr:PqqD family protein [Spirochaetales bacterium]
MAGIVINLDTIVSKASEQVSVDAGDDVVVLNAKTGIYFSLDDVSMNIWEMLEKPVGVRAILERLLLDYEVDAARCEKDLLSFLTDLVGQGLITEIQNT